MMNDFFAHWPDPQVGEVLEWGMTSWGHRYPKRIAIGYALNKNDRVIYKTPQCPKRIEDCVNYNLPIEKQKWRRFKDHPDWSWKAVRSRATDFPIGKGQYDLRWFDKDENLTSDMIAYREADWERRTNGVWIYIKGQLFYLTGKNYMYLQWSKLNKTIAPDFRERDLLWWWHAQACIEDPFCYGQLYLKHRRDGYTNRCESEQLEEITKTEGAVGTITSSYDKDHALEVIWPEIFLPLLKSWPPYFIPETDNGSDQPIGGHITFAERRRRGDSRLQESDEEFVSRSIRVTGASKEKSKGDGGKIKRAFWDETGKEFKRIIQKVLNTMKPALTQGGIYGKVFTGSTVEESTSGNSEQSGMSDQFAVLCANSRPSDRQSDGFTKSGLYFLFFPCWFCMDEDYVDEYGFSITNMPTEADIEFQKRRQWSRILSTVNNDPEKAHDTWELIKAQKYLQGGSYQWVLNYRAAASDDVELSQRKRLFPMTPDDALLPSAKAAYFSQNILTEALRNCELPDEKGNPQWKGFVRFGCFEWDETWEPLEGVFKGMTRKKFGGNVKWVDYPEGSEKARFTVQRKMLLNDPYCPYKPNMVFRDNPRGGDRPYGMIRPLNPILDKAIFQPNSLVFKIGCDPFEWDKQKTSERSQDLSKAGAWCKWVTDEGVDGELKGLDDDDVLAKQKSDSYVWVYHARPLKAEDFFEDMLKAAIYYGTPINVERDRSASFQQYFEANHCMSMLMPDQLALSNDSEIALHNPKKGTRAMHDIGFPYISMYVETHLKYLHKFPFPMGIRQLLSVSMENIGKHDLVAGMEQTEMCKVRPNRAVASLPQNSQLAHGANRQAGKSKGTAPTYSMR